MNEYISPQDLEVLISHQDKPAVSIFLPTTRITTRVQAEALQFKNLVRDAEERLEQYDLRGPEIRAMLEPARELVGDTEFWRFQKDGLAVFASQDNFLRYQLPTTFEPGLFVGESFHLKPLIPVMTSEMTFYILAVSQQNVRLIHCTRFSAEEIEPETFPTSVQEVLDEYVLDKQIQFHTSTATPGGGKRGAIFFGHGGGEDDDTDRIREFFGRIDQGLRDYLQGAPLLFAGLDHIFPIYRDANTYPNLVESNIDGNPEMLSPGELHRRAWRIIEPSLLAQQEADIERFHSSLPHDLATLDLDALVPWADQGRVETLFISKSANVWGTYDRENFKAKIQGGRTPRNRDLTDLAALFTMLRDGKVYMLTQEQMEMEFGADNRHLSNNGNSQNATKNPAAAAIYRYAV